MRVKVGNEWFETIPKQPIMVELTQQDKLNIQDMLPSASKYAVFSDEDEMDEGSKLSWMEAE